jgi:shikimate kinase
MTDVKNVFLFNPKQQLAKSLSKELHRPLLKFHPQHRALPLLQQQRQQLRRLQR